MIVGGSSRPDHVRVGQPADATDKSTGATHCRNGASWHYRRRPYFVLRDPMMRMGRTSATWPRSGIGVALESDGDAENCRSRSLALYSAENECCTLLGFILTPND